MDVEEELNQLLMSDVPKPPAASPQAPTQLPTSRVSPVVDDLNKILTLEGLYKLRGIPQVTFLAKTIALNKECQAVRRIKLCAWFDKDVINSYHFVSQTLIEQKM